MSRSESFQGKIVFDFLSAFDSHHYYHRQVSQTILLYLSTAKLLSQKVYFGGHDGITIRKSCSFVGVEILQITKSAK